MNLLKKILAHPLTRGLDLDDPRTTALRRQIIQNKKFLRSIYVEWYQKLADYTPATPGSVLELGSGAGFFKDTVPEAITSEIFLCPDIALVLNGLQLPFEDNTLKAIFMTDVFHHLPQPRRFFHEATRCIVPGGVIGMIEPWVTPWSKLIYTRLHHEPFAPDAQEWEFPTSGPLSGANGALPWIIFQRDRARFEKEFPGWSIEVLEPFMPLRYLLSGGVSLKNLVPQTSYQLWKSIEENIPGLQKNKAMFTLIVLRKRS